MRSINCDNCSQTFNFLTKSAGYDAESGLCVECLALRNELEYVNMIESIRSGNLPVVQSRISLPSAEICYWDAPVVYHKTLTSSTREVKGRLVITDHKIRFVSLKGGFECPISKLASIRMKGRNGIALQLTRASGSGFYAAYDADVLEEIALVVLDIHNRRVLYSKSKKNSRSVPQAVKSAVWQRDGGCCVECAGTQYLEYDHVIPHSKGGANTEGNLQLLCRGCNARKSDKI